MYWFASPLGTESVSEYEPCEGHWPNNQEDFIFQRSGSKWAITIYEKNKHVIILRHWVGLRKNNDILNVIECKAKIDICV